MKNQQIQKLQIDGINHPDIYLGIHQDGDFTNNPCESLNRAEIR